MYREETREERKARIAGSLYAPQDHDTVDEAGISRWLDRRMRILINARDVKGLHRNLAELYDVTQDEGLYLFNLQRGSIGRATARVARDRLLAAMAEAGLR